MFHEICIYEAKLEKQEKIEQLMKEENAEILQKSKMRYLSLLHKAKSSAKGF